MDSMRFKTLYSLLCGSPRINTFRVQHQTRLDRKSQHFKFLGNVLPKILLLKDKPYSHGSLLSNIKTENNLFLYLFTKQAMSFIPCCLHLFLLVCRIIITILITINAIIVFIYQCLFKIIELEI